MENLENSRAAAQGLNAVPPSMENPTAFEKGNESVENGSAKLETSASVHGLMAVLPSLENSRASGKANKGVDNRLSASAYDLNTFSGLEHESTAAYGVNTVSTSILVRRNSPLESDEKQLSVSESILELSDEGVSKEVQDVLAKQKELLFMLNKINFELELIHAMKTKIMAAVNESMMQTDIINRLKSSLVQANRRNQEQSEMQETITRLTGQLESLQTNTETLVPENTAKLEKDLVDAREAVASYENIRIRLMTEKEEAIAAKDKVIETLEKELQDRELVVERYKRLAEEATAERDKWIKTAESENNEYQTDDCVTPLNSEEARPTREPRNRISKLKNENSPVAPFPKPKNKETSADALKKQTRSPPVWGKATPPRTPPDPNKKVNRPVPYNKPSRAVWK